MVRFEECRHIGRIGKPHGHEGAVKLELFSELHTDLNIDEPVFLLLDGKPVPFFMASVNEDAHPPILHFERVTHMDAARKLQGLAVYAPKHSVEAERGWTTAQLVGYMAFDRGNKLGPIKEVLDSGLQQLLRLELKGTEVLIPLQEELIEDLNEERKQLFLQLPEGLLDIYLSNEEEE